MGVSFIRGGNQTARRENLSQVTDKLYHNVVLSTPRPREIRTHNISGVTLKDFKDHISVKGNYRYSFKALDPEFGTVKEEVCIKLPINFIIMMY
jgi:hypothetical protein